MLKISNRYKFTLSFLFLVGLIVGLFGKTFAQVTSPLWDYPIDLTQASSSTNAIDPVILCDQYQNTHILWGDRDDMPALYYMNDASGEWSAPMDVMISPYPDRLIIKLDADISNKDDVLHVLWVDQYLQGVLNYSRVQLDKANDSRAWSPPFTLHHDTYYGSIDIDIEGIIHVVYGTSSPDYLDVALEYINSSDGGTTWSTPIQFFSKQSGIPIDTLGRVAVDDEGRIHVGVVIRSQDYGIYSEVGYIRSLDNGQSWSDYRIIDYQGTAYQGVNVIAPYTFGKDEIHLTWHDPRRMHQWSSDGGRTWSEPREVMPLGAAFGGPNALTQDSNGVIHIVTAVNGGAYSASWDGGLWGPPEQLEDREFDPHSQDITICQGNKLQVVYDDRSDTQSIWYSGKTENAPFIEQSVIPNSAHVVQNPDEVAIKDGESSSPPVEVVQNPNAPAVPITFPENSPQVPSNPLTPIIIAAVVVLLLVLVVFVFRFR